MRPLNCCNFFLIGFWAKVNKEKGLLWSPPSYPFNVFRTVLRHPVYIVVLRLNLSPFIIKKKTRRVEHFEYVRCNAKCSDSGNRFDLRIFWVGLYCDLQLLVFSGMCPNNWRWLPLTWKSLVSCKIIFSLQFFRVRALEKLLCIYAMHL